MDHTLPNWRTANIISLESRQWGFPATDQGSKQLYCFKPSTHYTLRRHVCVLLHRTTLTCAITFSLHTLTILIQRAYKNIQAKMASCTHVPHTLEKRTGRTWIAQQDERTALWFPTKTHAWTMGCVDGCVVCADGWCAWTRHSAQGLRILA